MKQETFRNVDPPFWVAWHQARASIRVRFGRHVLTTLGIALGTAFFASMQTLVAAELDTARLDAMGVSRLNWLAGTSLLMCLAGVTNSMLMSVTERFREIGTIKCLGASDGFIVKVFFLEAMLLGALGTTAGALVGTALMSVAVTLMGFDLSAWRLPGFLGISVLIGVALTVLSAILPAVQAAKMPAAAALRVEV